MVRLCSRPGCSEQGSVAYGMVPEDLLFWMAPIAEAPTSDASVLCRRHADAMVVPRGWTLDDRRESVLRLFRPRRSPTPDPQPARRSRRSRPTDGERPEQLQIDGTGEIARPSGLAVEAAAVEPATAEQGAASTPADDDARPAAWEPEFDHDDDLGGLLEVDSPLLSRAFRGTGRPR